MAKVAFRNGPSTFFSTKNGMISGSIHRSIDRAGLSGGLCWIPEGQRNRGPLLCQGDGLSGGAQFPGNFRKRIGTLRQKGASKRGD